MWCRNSLEQPPESVMTSTCPRSCSGSCSSAASRVWRWSCLSHGDALPGRRSKVRVSPVPYSPCHDRIDERAHRVEPIGLLERRRRALLVRMRVHQRGIQIHRHLATVPATGGAGQRPAPLPHRLTGAGSGGADRRQRGLDIGGQRRKQPRHRGITGDRAEQVQLRPHHSKVSQAVTAKRDGGRDIQQHLARIMDGSPGPPRSQRLRQHSIQPRHPGHLPQQNPTRGRDQRLADIIQHHTGNSIRLHLRSAFHLARIGPSASPTLPSRTGTSVRYTPPTPPKTRNLEARDLRRRGLAAPAAEDVDEHEALPRRVR